MTQIFHAGGVPKGVLNLVHADGAQTFAGLERALEQRLVDKVGFTGSSAVGAEIGALCGRHLQSPCLELGGKNPMVVMDDADLDLAVEGALFAGFGTAGQRCTSLGTAIVHASVHDEFVRRLDERLRGGGGRRPDRRRALRPDAARALRRAVRGLARADPRRTTRRTARPRRAGSRPDAPREGFVGDPEAGIFYHPTFVTGVTIEDEIYGTETFGPLVGVARFDTFDEAIELANGHGYGLSSAIYTTSPTHAFRFRERISAGMVSINNSTSGAEAHLPFGGNGKSGNGSRQSGIWVLDQFTRWQSMNWDYAGKLQKAQMDLVEIEAGGLPAGGARVLGRRRRSRVARGGAGAVTLPVRSRLDPAQRLSRNSSGRDPGSLPLNAAVDRPLALRAGRVGAVALDFTLPPI